MRIQIGTRHELSILKTTIDIKGSGTIEDPFIITPIRDPSWSPFYSITLSHSKSYIQLTNSKEHIEAPFFLKDNSFLKPYYKKFIPKKVLLKDCSNLTIINSLFHRIKIIESSDITIQNVTIMKKLDIKTSDNIILKDSMVNVFSSRNCKNILISSCSIKKITKKTNRSSIQYKD